VKKNSVRVGIVGATGQVGSLVRRLLLERGFPTEFVRCFASSRSAGTRLRHGDEVIEVEDLSTAPAENSTTSRSSAGADTSLQHAPRFADAGAVVIDNSSAWRSHPEVPLVVSDVNPHALRAMPRGIVANPNCTTMIAMPALKPLHELAGLRRLTVSTYQAVSGMGRAGGDELLVQTSHLMDAGPLGLVEDGAAAAALTADVFPEPVAFNVVPFAGKLIDDWTNETTEERKLRDETRKILALPSLPVSATCVRVPVFTGHSLSINADFENPIGLADAHRALKASSGVELDEVPTPLRAAGTDVPRIGRIRRDPGAPGDRGLSFFVTGDNLRKGAALNAVQLAERVAARRLGLST
jgi:aspartate-semialdehyde dehydrogenase